MVTSPPASTACLAYVAIRSSASYPSCSMQATLKARVASRMIENWGTRSSGAGGRLRLVVGINVVAEGAAGIIEDDGDMARLEFVARVLQQLPQHLAKAMHRAHGQPV